MSLGPAHRFSAGVFTIRLRTMVVIGIEGHRGALNDMRDAAALGKRHIGPRLTVRLDSEVANGNVLPDCIALPALPSGYEHAFLLFSQDHLLGYFYVPTNSLSCSFHSRFQLLDSKFRLTHAHNHRPSQATTVCV